MREKATADGKANVQQEIQLTIDRAIAADNRAAEATTRAEAAESALEKLKKRCKVFLDALESLPEKMHNYFKSCMRSAATHKETLRGTSNTTDPGQDPRDRENEDLELD